MPIVGELAGRRYPIAVEVVAASRAADPAAGPDELADRLIRQCARDLAIGGAVAGGAAASPVSGAAAVAATVGIDATFGIGRLSELIMEIGLVYGHDQSSIDERTAAVTAVLGLSEGAAIGLTGIAARVGSRGGARLVSKLPGVAGGPQAAAGATRRAAARTTVGRLSNSKGPWSLAALIPYTIGAGVGAAGNALLARSVGSAARQYFAALPPPRHDAIVEDAGTGDVVDEPLEEPSGSTSRRDADIVDAVIVERGQN